MTLSFPSTVNNSILFPSACSQHLRSDSIIQELFQDQNWVENLILLSLHVFNAMDCMIEDVEKSFQLLLCAFHEFPLHSIIHEFNLFEAPNTAQVLPCAFESLNNTTMSFHYIQSHVRLRWARSLNAAQILVRGCWSSMCLQIFKLNHELPLHSIMCKFRWAKSLNAAQIWCEPADHLCPSQIFE